MSDDARDLVTAIGEEILNPLIGLLFALALVYFIYGIVVFIANADNETEREKGKQHILYSVIGLVIMVGAWGIIELILASLGPNVSAPEGFEQLN